MRAWLLMVVLVVGILAGCSGVPTQGPDGGQAGASPAGSVTHVKVATISPLSGGQSSLGVAIKNGAELASANYVERLQAAGVHVELTPQDDKADPPTGSQIAEKLLSDRRLVAVVGTLNSGVAKGVAPILLRGNVAMVSPANTGVTLTESGWNNFTRIIFRDDSQGPAAARFAAQEIDARRVAVLHDKTEYGQGLAEEFVKEAGRQGLVIVNGAGRGEGIEPAPRATDWSAALTPIVAQSPDLIFFGGIYDTAAPLLRQAREKGFSGRFMGGDGLDSSTFVELGSDAVEGAYYTSIDADYSQGSGKDFFDRYRSEYNNDPPAYAAYGYDAMRVVLEAIITAAGAGKADDRATVLAAVKATRDFQGLGGAITFDARGDNPEADVYVFTIQQGKPTSLGPAPK